MSANRCRCIDLTVTNRLPQRISPMHTAVMAYAVTLSTLD